MPSSLDTRRHRPDTRSRRRPRPTLALGLAGFLAFASGFTSSWSSSRVPEPSPQLVLAQRYVGAWERGDYRAMYRLLTPAVQRRVTSRRFAELHREAVAAATATGLTRVGAFSEPRDGLVRVRMRVRTRAFGALTAAADLPVGDGVRWERRLVFPGLRRGERLRRSTRLPPRADLLAADGSMLAGGSRRAPEAQLADVAAQTVGTLGPATDELAARLYAEGVPRRARVGRTGLEAALEERLRGTPGGTLRAGRRVLARRAPRRAAPVRTTIVPRLVRSAIAALAGRIGGAVAIEPRTGAVLAYAGIPFSGLQPPGSTFKILTLVAALESGAATTRSSYARRQAATLAGVELQNADGEVCGGSLVESFAHSCNSVFGPLGARVGARRLVDVAERFGFNRPSDIPGAATSTIPAPEQIGDELAVGSTAIGQGKVMATALQMATTAATIGRWGRRPTLTVDADRARRPAARRVTSRPVARIVERAMRAAVQRGTGTAAAIPGIPVAGKTGTAELRSTQSCVPGCAMSDDPTDTDAWFAGYAPTGRGAPRVAVAVMLVSAGTGGATAAPAARRLLTHALRDGSRCTPRVQSAAHDSPAGHAYDGKGSCATFES